MERVVRLETEEWPEVSEHWMAKGIGDFDRSQGDCIVQPHNGEMVPVWSEPHRSPKPEVWTEFDITTDPAEAPADCEDEWWMRDAHKAIRAKYGHGIEGAMDLLGFRPNSYGMYQKDFEDGEMDVLPGELVLRFLLGYEYVTPGAGDGSVFVQEGHTIPAGSVVMCHEIDFRTGLFGVRVRPPTTKAEAPCPTCNGSGRVCGVFFADAWTCETCGGEGVV